MKKKNKSSNEYLYQCSYFFYLDPPNSKVQHPIDLETANFISLTLTCKPKLLDEKNIEDFLLQLKHQLHELISIQRELKEITF